MPDEVRKGVATTIGSDEGKQLILATVAEAARGQVGRELIRQVESDHAFILKVKMDASAALPEIQNAETEAKSFRNEIDDTRRAFRQSSVENENVGRRLTAVENQELNERLGDVQRVVSTLKTSSGWQWGLGILCFVGMLTLITIAVVRQRKARMEVNKLNKLPRTPTS